MTDRDGAVEVWGHKTGAELIAQERQRQIEAEGWTPDHDDQHVRHELAWAASCYAAPETVYRVRVDPERGVYWEEPWPTEIGSARGNPYPFPWRRPECDRITQLVKAGALIAAEIDRLRRAEEDIEYEPCSCMNENGETVRVGPEDFCTECFTPRGCCGPGRPVDRGSNGTS